MDWTASAFGLVVTLTGGLLTLVALLVRRELDQQRERMRELEQRIRTLERENFALRPLAKVLQRNMDEDATTIARRLNA